jgi:UDP-N-acetylglucosamine 2-epimerase (non-hydrolysing)
MVDQVLESFDITPDTDLDLMRRNQTLPGLTARAITALDQYLADECPDLVLIQGDTTTVFCAALAAFYRRVPVGHVEAGLRTWDLNAPWPEEANRVLASRLAALHFAPTRWSKENLLREGIPEDRVFVTGNTVVDALLLGLKKIRDDPPRIAGLPNALQQALPSGGRAETRPRLVLITGHRRESFGEGLESICRATAQLAGSFPDVHFVYPVHLNPNVLAAVNRVLGGRHGNTRSARGGGRRRLEASGRSNLHLIEPLAYLPFIALMSRACLILTDSGGIQEEAPSLGKPVLVMRDITERPEALKAGGARLVGTRAESIVKEATRILQNSGKEAAPARRTNPYGDGKAATRIARACLDYLRGRAHPADL